MKIFTLMFMLIILSMSNLLAQHHTSYSSNQSHYTNSHTRHSQTATHLLVNRSTTHSNFNNNNQHHHHAPVCMASFDAWLYNLSHVSNTAVRMTMAMDYVAHNWLTTHQVYHVLEQFSSNQSCMLRIAEEAYPRTCDPYNFEQVYALFSNRACVMHLQHFVVGR